MGTSWRWNLYSTLLAVEKWRWRQFSDMCCTRPIQSWVKLGSAVTNPNCDMQARFTFNHCFRSRCLPRPAPSFLPYWYCSVLTKTSHWRENQELKKKLWIACWRNTVVDWKLIGWLIEFWCNSAIACRVAGHTLSTESYWLLTGPSSSKRLAFSMAQDTDPYSS